MHRIQEITNVDAGTLERFDALIDVRSPAEFAEDRIPGAVNLPVLSDRERAEVGTTYKQDSKFKARRIGAAYVSQNVAAHLETYFTDKPPAFRPLLYCWRGGMRSNAMATILARVGWRVGVLKGGYKTWRREVARALRESDEPLNLVLLDGQTGTAKSEILGRLVALGVQTIDLEGLAAHRGSVFGALPTRTQPSQKMFESLLWRALREFDGGRPVVVEAESNRIGCCELPPRIWNSMAAAPRIVLYADASARARYLVNAYADAARNRDAVIEAVNRLGPFHSKAQIEAWRDMTQADEFLSLADSLMREHYDPLYDRSRKRRPKAPMATLRLDGLDADAIGDAARKIDALLKGSNCAKPRGAIASAYD